MFRGVLERLVILVAAVASKAAGALFAAVVVAAVVRAGKGNLQVTVGVGLLRVSVCLLLQYLLQSCSRGGRGIVEDMCSIGSLPSFEELTAAPAKWGVALFACTMERMRWS